MALSSREFYRDIILENMWDMPTLETLCDFLGPIFREELEKIKNEVKMGNFIDECERKIKDNKDKK